MEFNFPLDSPNSAVVVSTGPSITQADLPIHTCLINAMWTQGRYMKWSELTANKFFARKVTPNPLRDPESVTDAKTRRQAASQDPSS